MQRISTSDLVLHSSLPSLTLLSRQFSKPAAAAFDHIDLNADNLSNPSFIYFKKLPPRRTAYLCCRLLCLLFVLGSAGKLLFLDYH